MRHKNGFKGPVYIKIEEEFVPIEITEVLETEEDVWLEIPGGWLAAGALHEVDLDAEQAQARTKRGRARKLAAVTENAAIQAGERAVMSRGIIIVEECAGCPYSALGFTADRICIRTGEPCPEGGRPALCPLPNTPAKEITTALYAYNKSKRTGNSASYCRGWAQGFNECLQKIGGAE